MDKIIHILQKKIMDGIKYLKIIYLIKDLDLDYIKNSYNSIIKPQTM